MRRLLCIVELRPSQKSSTCESDAMGVEFIVTNFSDSGRIALAHCMKFLIKMKCLFLLC